MAEEEEAIFTGVSGTPSNLIEVLRQAHRENGRLHYFATSDPKIRGRRTMPVTPFVFELFIYNSIYQVDWPASLQARQVVNQPRDGATEPVQQRQLERFLKPHLKEEPALLYHAFIPIRDASLEGDWTVVVSDPRVSAEDGNRFFERLRQLRKILRDVDEPKALQVTNSCLELIADCRSWVQDVGRDLRAKTTSTA